MTETKHDRRTRATYLMPALIRVAVDPADLVAPHMTLDELAELTEAALRAAWPTCIVDVRKADAAGEGFVTAYDLDPSGLIVRSDHALFRRIRQVVDQTWERYADAERPA
jgi:hypothetical protein